MQFLLNFDGSIPAGANVEALAALGIPLVRPSPRPTPLPGMKIIEVEPHQIDGVWWQSWEQVELPSEEDSNLKNEEYLPEINRVQFAKFLATPPLRDIFLMAEIEIENINPLLYEEFQKYKKLSVHNFDEAVSIILRLLSYFPNNDEINSESLVSIWKEAANF